MNILQPPSWTQPRGYVNGIAASGVVISVAGQVGWNAQGKFETDDLVGQIRQALANVLAVLAEADAGPHHIVRVTWYQADHSKPAELDHTDTGARLTGGSRMDRRGALRHRGSDGEKRRGGPGSGDALVSCGAGPRSLAS